LGLRSPARFPAPASRPPTPLTMERTIQKHGGINLIILLAAGLAALVVSLYCQVLSGRVACVFLGVGVLVALVSWFQMRLEDRERLEKLEFDELTRGGPASATLFKAGDAEAFPAQRSREQFEKFFVPGFTILLMLAQGTAFWWLWRWLGRIAAVPPLQQPFVAMSVLGLLALVLFLLGQYSSGLARLEKQRLLGPAATGQLFAAYLLALVVLGVVGIQAGFPTLDYILARALCVLLGVLAVENLFVLLLEIYRPRVRGRVAHLLYDSRLVGLISHPEGIFTTLAHTLDYQF